MHSIRGKKSLLKIYNLLCADPVILVIIKVSAPTLGRIQGLVIQMFSIIFKMCQSRSKLQSAKTDCALISRNGCVWIDDYCVLSLWTGAKRYDCFLLCGFLFPSPLIFKIISVLVCRKVLNINRLPTLMCNFRSTITSHCRAHRPPFQPIPFALLSLPCIRFVNSIISSLCLASLFKAAACSELHREGLIR